MGAIGRSFQRPNGTAIECHAVETSDDQCDRAERTHQASRGLAVANTKYVTGYRGRIAPSPTGLLHLGHARTFWIARQRALQREGMVVLRNEDLDRSRCRREFVDAMLEDLKWIGIEWHEGPDQGGPFAPYQQSDRQEYYRAAFERLQETGRVYPCACSRQDIARALQAPHAPDDEPIYPGTCRPGQNECAQRKSMPNRHWRFRVPDGECIRFVDGHFGAKEYVAGKHFGDFVVWRQDGIPAYQLAVVVDDHEMRITEVVRGEDLLLSTARQLLLYEALEWSAPTFFHCPLVTDASGVRLAKRHDALSLRALREGGACPETLREGWEELARSAPTPRLSNA